MPKELNIPSRLIEDPINTRDLVVDRFFKGNVLDKYNFRIPLEKFPKLELRQAQQLQNIAHLAPVYIRGARELLQIVMTDGPFQQISKTCGTIRKLYSPLSDDGVQEKHVFVRFDLMLDLEGNIKIAEIEVDKLFGLGYVTLASHMVDSTIGKGVLEEMSEIMDNKLTGVIISGEREFYLLELGFLSRMLKSVGQDLIVVTQDQVKVEKNRMHCDGRPVDQIFSPLSFQSRNKGAVAGGANLNDEIDRLVLEGSLTKLHTPRSYLKSKSMLGIISNAQQDPDLEFLVSSVFSKKEISQFRKYLPPTESLDISQRHHTISQRAYLGKKYFIKPVDSFGTRGIETSADLCGQLSLIASGISIIVQQEVTSQTNEFKFVDIASGVAGTGKLKSRYGLVTNSRGEILDVAITASAEKMVHGGPKSLLTGLNYE